MGKKEENFLASSALWHTQHLLYLPGWAGGYNSPTTFSMAAQIQPCSLPPHVFQGFPSLPLYKEVSFSYFQYQICFSLSTANLFWCCPCSSKIIVLDHSSMGFNPLPMPPSFTLLLETWKPPQALFLGSLILLPPWGWHLWTHFCVTSADYYLLIGLPFLVFPQCSRWQTAHKSEHSEQRRSYTNFVCVCVCAPVCAGREGVLVDPFGAFHNQESHCTESTRKLCS